MNVLPSETSWVSVVALRCFFVLGVLVLGCGRSSETEPTVANEVEPTGSVPIGAEPNGSNRDESTASLPSDSADDRQRRLDRGDQLVESDDLDRAADIFRQLLIVDPDDVEVLFRLANVRASQGKLAEGIELLDAIPQDHPQAGLAALGQSADWLVQLGKYDEAVSRYLTILKLAPEASMAHRRVAWLLNRQGRRHEAAEHIRELCRLGDIRQDELHALIVLSDAMVSEPDDAGDESADYTPIGASGQARVLFTERRFAQAAEVLRPTVGQGNAPPSIIAFYGRIVAEAQDDHEFLRWLDKVDQPVREFSEYWSAVAAYLVSRQQHEAATRALLEALDRDPTDFMSINRLHHMLMLLGQPEEAEKWKQRWTANQQILVANNAITDDQTPNVQAMDELASQLFAIDRKLEAVMWKSLEGYYRKLPQESMQHWMLERQQLVDRGSGFPDQASRICGMTLDSYPLPTFEDRAIAADASLSGQAWTGQPSPPASFPNVAADIGLTHSYRVAIDDLESGFTMYHQAGGGVAVLDYDCDGRADMYFAQGAADPPSFVAEQSNLLYRSLDRRVVDVTAEASAVEYRYTIGCTAGDWNQDGFPDLITANIGSNRLLINNGDGTFTARQLPGSDDLQRMPASVAIADLDGDHLPDIFELNYIDDPQIAKLPARSDSGTVIDAVGPGDFSPAIDRIGINDGSGGVHFSPIADQPSAAHHGLGVVIANFDGQPGNDVFVGNDKSANQLWVREGDSANWVDVAIVKGIAFSSGGGGTASMGIAAGDFDHTGTLDLHVVNFQNEIACLYLNRDASFRDRAVQFKLDVPSRSVLGFGSQSLDFDNDGNLDLAVSNGHVDQYESMSGPFRQMPQLFCNRGDQFRLWEVIDSSNYWQTGHLGRGLARIDFNRDGKNDLVVTHLGETSALLLNETQTDHHWLQLQLIGVRSERDAVGATIRVRAGERQWSEWVLGGDGYLCRNEAVVSFGLGEATKVDQVNIDWPSGVTQTLSNVAADQRLLVVENDSQPFTLELRSE